MYDGLFSTDNHQSETSIAGNELCGRPGRICKLNAYGNLHSSLFVTQLYMDLVSTIMVAVV